MIEAGTKIEKIDTYFEIETITETEKLDYISGLFKRGTFTRSLYSKELIKINEKYGYYSNGIVYQLCEYEEIKKDNPDFPNYSNKEYIITYDYKHLKEATYNDIYELLDNETKEKCDNILKEQIEKYNNKNKNRIYIETDIDKDKLRFYAEFYGSCYEIYLRKSVYNSDELFIKGFSVNTDRNNGIYNLKEAIEKEMYNKVNYFLENEVNKIENGYIFKNKYYENLEDIEDIIKESEKEEC